MCRLSAYYGPDRSPAPILYGGSHPLQEQAWAPRELLHGSVNADGWGVAWLGEGDEMVRLARSEPIWFDGEVPGLLRQIRSRGALAALRNATIGLPVDGSGRLPMLREGWAFALNGFVPSFRARHMRALRAPLSDERYASLEGVSDAETLFLLTLQALEGGSEPLDALDQVRRRVGDRLKPGEDAPLTMVLLGAEGLWALNSSAGGPVNSLYLGEGVEPMGVGVTMASERLSEGAWRPVEPHTGVAVTPNGIRIEELGPLR